VFHLLGAITAVEQTSLFHSTKVRKRRYPETSDLHESIKNSIDVLKAFFLSKKYHRM
jgi:hypothetical protein